MTAAASSSSASAGNDDVDSRVPPPTPPPDVGDDGTPPLSHPAPAASSRAVVVPAVSHSDLFGAIESCVLTCRPLVDLFFPPSSSSRHRRGRRGASSSSSAADDDDDDDDDDEHEHEHENGPTTGTANQRREAVLDVVRDPGFHKSRSRRLFGGMMTALAGVVEGEEYLPPNDDDDEGGGGDAADDDDDDDHGAAPATAEEEAEEAVRFLGCCAHLVEAYLRGMLSKQKKHRGGDDDDDDDGGEGRRRGRRCRGQKKIEVVDEAFDVAGTLHDLLFPLQQGRCQQSPPPSSSSSTSRRWSRHASRAQSAIFSMCETWWHGNFADRERMVTQLVPLLLVRSLDAAARRDDVRRLCSVRGAIDLLDFDDTEGISSLKVHLLRTVGDPLFLRCAEGRRFVGHLLLVDANFVSDVHGAVLAQIPGARGGVLDAFAEIYYGAWRASTEMEATTTTDDHEDDGDNGEGAMMGAIQSSIEENALQDLMHRAMHASSSPTAKSARAVLDRFRANKKSADVESMLHRTYGPLLWRGLTSANAKVRSRALAVLADTFPLRDPSAAAGGGGGEGTVAGGGGGGKGRRPWWRGASRRSRGRWATRCRSFARRGARRRRRYSVASGR